MEHTQAYFLSVRGMFSAHVQWEPSCAIGGVGEEMAPQSTFRPNVYPQTLGRSLEHYCRRIKSLSQALGRGRDAQLTGFGAHLQNGAVWGFGGKIWYGRLRAAPVIQGEFDLDQVQGQDR